MTGPPSFCMLVPTTGGVMRILSLMPRPGLPHSAAFTDGDYRPLALSPDYRALAGPEGPIARHLGTAPDPHELRLSGAPEAGRSWEAPVAVAHLLLARGWTLENDPANARLTVWATGALDLDLSVIPGDYQLVRKADLSLDDLRRAGHDTLLLLPPGEGREDAATRLEQACYHPRRVDRLSGLDDVFQTYEHPSASPAKIGQPSLMRFALPGAALALALIGFAQFGANVGAPDEPVNSDTDPPDPQIEVTPEVPPQPQYTVLEVRSAPGGSCRQALFDAAQRRTTPVAWVDDRYTTTTFSADLCGVAVGHVADETIPDIQSDPGDAFIEVETTQNQRAFFLRQGVQNVVYWIPDTVEDGAFVLRHEIRPAE